MRIIRVKRLEGNNEDTIGYYTLLNDSDHVTIMGIVNLLSQQNIDRIHDFQTSETITTINIPTITQNVIHILELSNMIVFYSGNTKYYLDIDIMPDSPDYSYGGRTVNLFRDQDEDSTDEDFDDSLNYSDLTDYSNFHIPPPSYNYDNMGRQVPGSIRIRDIRDRQFIRDILNIGQGELTLDDHITIVDNPTDEELNSLIRGITRNVLDSIQPSYQQFLDEYIGDTVAPPPYMTIKRRDIPAVYKRRTKAPSPPLNRKRTKSKSKGKSKSKSKGKTKVLPKGRKAKSPRRQRKLSLSPKKKSKSKSKLKKK